MLAATGYVMPSNVDALNSEDFLQTGQRPLHSDVFTRRAAPRPMLPSTTTWPSVADATAVSLNQLFYEPVILPLQERLEAIDAGVGAVVRPVEGHPVGLPSREPSTP